MFPPFWKIHCTALLFLTQYHTIPHFDALKIYSCGKHCEKRKNCLLQAISPFLTMFSTLYGMIFHFKCTLKCCPQFVSVWTSLKFCHLEMVKSTNLLIQTILLILFQTAVYPSTNGYPCNNTYDILS